MNHRRLTDESARGQRDLIDAAWQEAAELAGGSSQIPAADRPGRVPILSDTFPGYEVIRESHRGGQGIVFQAIQKSTRRQVAIKALREGILSDPRDRARFEREVHILGLLKHPHIVTIHDSGEAAGCSYFVMDFVEGQPLDDYAKDLKARFEGKAALIEQLRLFAKACDAVNAAHLRGVIHRDLKPGNILVDAQGEPRVLDFGLAKRTSEGAGFDSTIAAMTQVGQFVGSMPWASPEQAGGDGGAVDLRSDVYSLGVLLFQVLTGRFPYPVDGGPQTILHHVLHADPTRPSAYNERIDAEVETIVLKCLAKEPGRRYETAGELARDIRRYLADEPILARPPTAAYQIRKFVRRNRPLVGGLIAAALALAAGAATAVWQAVAATRARNGATIAAQLASQKQREAERSARTAKHVQAFLQDMLASADPDQAQGRDATLLLELLDKASQRVDRELADEPQVAADVRFAIAHTYMSVGRYKEAVSHIRAVVALRRQLREADDASVAAALAKLAKALEENDDLAEAEARAREALTLRRSLFGEQHVDVADSLHLIGEVLFSASLVAGDEQRAAAMLKEAEESLDEALNLRRQLLDPDDMEIARTLMFLANIHARRQSAGPAEKCYGDALEILRRQPTPQPRAVATVSCQLAYVKEAQGNWSEARTLLGEALEFFRTGMGPEHPSVATTSAALARIASAMGDPVAAESYYRTAAAIRRKEGNKSKLADVIHWLGLTCQHQRKYDEALSNLRESLALYREVYGDRHPFVGRATGNLARLLVARGEFEEAEGLLNECLTILRAALGEKHPDIGSTHERWIELYDAWHAAQPDGGADVKGAEARKTLAAWRATTQPATQPSDNS